MAWPKYAFCRRIAMFLLLGLGALAVPTLVAAQMCKWVDEEGTVHYAERCPENVDSGQLVEIHRDPAPSTGSAPGQEGPAHTGRDPDRNARSLSIEKLGRLPDNTRSRYLETAGTGVVSPLVEGSSGNFTLTLTPTIWLPTGSLVAVRFPDPANPGRGLFTERVYDGSGEDMHINSPDTSGFKCWTYHVIVHVYADKTRQKLLGKHEQRIQSRFDTTRARTEDEIVAGLARGYSCPGSPSGSQAPSRGNLERMSASQLEAACEAAREKRLAPERVALVRRCMENEGKDRTYCERFYKDYGAAKRSGNIMLPRLYDNLPECVAARKARGH